jgi:histidine triad (HIT) family protein
MPDCIFCKIASGEVPSYAIKKTDGAMAFLDIHPLAPGHTVVIPTRHGRFIEEFSDDEVKAIFVLVRDVAALLKERMKAEGITIGLNQGDAAHEGVAHLHVHLLPRFADDGGGSLHTIVKNPPSESLEEVLKKLA